MTYRKLLEKLRGWGANLFCDDAGLQAAALLMETGDMVVDLVDLERERAGLYASGESNPSEVEDYRRRRSIVWSRAEAVAQRCRGT